MNWIDNADSWICPVCRLEVSSPAKYKDCKCPKCGFQDAKDHIEIDPTDEEIQKVIEIFEEWT